MPRARLIGLRQDLRFDVDTQNYIPFGGSMRIPSVSLSPVMMRSMPSIDQIARVEKRIPVASVNRKGPLASTTKSNAKKRKTPVDGLGQEVDVFA
jgi:hypothetical protein